MKLAAGTLDLGRDAATPLDAEETRAIVAKGKGKMPAFGKKLKATELDLVTAYAAELAAARRAKAR